MSDETPNRGILPETRKLIIVVLALIAALCVGLYGALAIYGVSAGGELLALATGAVAGIVGIVQQTKGDDR